MEDVNNQKYNNSNEIAKEALNQEDFNKDVKDKKDGYGATLTSNQGEHTVKKTDVNINIDKDNPDSRKIVIEKQVNVVHKISDNLKKSEINLLEEIHQTSLMAVQSIEYLVKDISDKMKKELDLMLTAYKGIYGKAIEMMSEHGIEPTKVNPLAKAFRWSSIKISSMAKRTDSHIAEMMINGTTMGVIEMVRAINKCSAEPSKEPRKTANELMNLMKSSINSLERFL